MDAVIYTDDDGSVHPGEISLLVEPFVNKSTPAVVSPAAMRDGIRRRKAMAA